MSVFRKGLFNGKVALVTGGGSGIGQAISVELMSLGAHVIIASRRADRLAAALARLQEAKLAGSASSVQMNIREEESVARAIDDIIQKHGKIDLLVNNGGGQFASDAASMRAKGWRAVIDTNLTGTFLVTQRVYRSVPTPRAGLAVVNIIADYFSGFPGMAHTGAARAGVDNLTKTLAREWAAEGVRVNAVAPGIIASSGINNYPAELRPMFVEAGNSVPLGRAGTESEVAAATVFLLTPAAAYITGATLRVDGGGSLSKRDFISPAAGGDGSPGTAATLAPFHLTSSLAEEYNGRVAAEDSAAEDSAAEQRPPSSKL